MRIALIGPHGYGWTHRRAIHRLELAGRAQLVALGARGAVQSAEDAPVDGVPIYPDHRRLLADVEPDIVVVATPAHAHLPVAVDCPAAGADLLLEKPAVASLTDLAALSGALRRHGTACQVGFQSLASPALTEVVAALRRGPLGPLRAVCVVGAWWRPDAYFRRNEWAGRRSLHGQQVVDGAIANQFSHAIMQCLAIAEAAAPGSTPALLEIERYRTGDIEVDDTACLRITLDGGVRVHAAVTVRGIDLIKGEIGVLGDRRADLEYITDRLSLPAGTAWRTVAGRVHLLDNLLAHRDENAQLIAPLERTAGFTAVLAAVLAGPAPTLIERRYLRPHPAGDGLAVDGVAGLLRAAAAQTALFSELGVPWAHAPHRVELARIPPTTG